MFNEGDRVEYTGARGGYGSDSKLGKMGTVTEFENDNVRVTFDGLGSRGVYPDNIKLITAKTVASPKDAELGAIELITPLMLALNIQQQIHVLVYLNSRFN